MAPYIPAPNTIQVEWRYTFLGQQMENTMSFLNVGGWTNQLAATFGQTLITWWNTNLAPYTSTLVVLRELYITDLSSQNGFTVSVVPGSVVNGDDADAPLPPQTAFVITLRTNQRGRSFRGRWFALGATEQMSTNGQATQAYATAVEDAIQALIALGGEEILPVVVSRRANKVPRVTAITTQIVNAVARDLNWDTMRSRAIGNGN